MFKYGRATLPYCVLLHDNLLPGNSCASALRSTKSEEGLRFEAQRLSLTVTGSRAIWRATPLSPEAVRWARYRSRLKNKREWLCSIPKFFSPLWARQELLRSAQRITKSFLKVIQPTLFSMFNKAG